MGSKVSQTVLISERDISGVLTTTSVVNNFVCSSGTLSTLSHCSYYNPSDPNQPSAAWNDEGECIPSAASPLVSRQMNTPTPQWIGTGCPEDWVANMEIGPGDLVQCEGLVYKCSDSGFSSFCSQSGFKPGDSLYWRQVWTLVGSCDSTISPTTSPNFIKLAFAGGCPDEYQSGFDYDVGDIVSIHNIVYSCRTWPHTQYCRMQGFEPDGPHSEEGWQNMGYCDGM